ncbi:hypothetical protein PAFU01_07130 [Pantoea ananatis]|nr:hypothetical protein PAFU01_07130 [Pantoea ananatis]
MLTPGFKTADSRPKWRTCVTVPTATGAEQTIRSAEQSEEARICPQDAGKKRSRYRKYRLRWFVRLTNAAKAPR